jgi:hypothetical protein
MDEKKDADFRVRLPEQLREDLIDAFRRSRVSQVEGMSGLAEFFLRLDDVGRAIVLGQIDGANSDLLRLLAGRLNAPTSGAAPAEEMPASVGEAVSRAVERGKDPEQSSGKGGARSTGRKKAG